ncbi:MAG TPA: glutamate formimidoyltransferase [Terriglobia bacterium]
MECVPNFSEGRDRAKMAQIQSAIESVSRVRVLDLHMDPDHHRSVITFVGDEQGILEAAVRGVAEAAARIDLNHHRGEHPRIGAADVVPFVPIQGVTLADCASIAHRAGEEIYRRCGVPVYFYGAAARQAGRTLAQLRRGGFERLRDAVGRDLSLRPDVGEPRLHPTAGATAVGARPILIAFNILLQSSDVEMARRIARTVRASSGGLPAVQAMGVLLRSKAEGGTPGQAQVSMNLTDLQQTSLAAAYGAVAREATLAGVALAGSEVVGLLPAKALEGIRPEDVGITNFTPRMILENRLAEAGY